MSIISFHLKNWLFTNKILINWLKQLACENLSQKNKSPNMVTDYLRNIFKWNKVSWRGDRLSGEMFQMEQFLLISRQLVWVYYFDCLFDLLSTLNQRKLAYEEQKLMSAQSCSALVKCFWFKDYWCKFIQWPVKLSSF